MISETAFLDCENLPAEMAGRFDQPWHFVGEVKADRLYWDVVCGRCHKAFAGHYPIGRQPTTSVTMKGHSFITDDMLEVVVYFGVCGECDAVYWARQGPPFRRVRRRITV